MFRTRKLHFNFSQIISNFLWDNFFCVKKKLLPSKNEKSINQKNNIFLLIDDKNY